MEQNIELSQKQTLTQHMIQSMEILQMSAQELESYVETLALENPVIELEERPLQAPSSAREDLQRKLDWLESTDQQNKVYYQQERSSSSLENNWHDRDWAEESLSDYLLSQILLADFSDADFSILEFMILSLDERGYYPDDLTVAADRFQTAPEHIERLLAVIQSLDPAGIGARTLQECLLLQLRRTRQEHPLMEALIQNYLPEIAKNHLPEIARELNCPIPTIQEACAEIRKLSPKPGSAFCDRNYLRYIEPDVIVVKLEDSFEILVNEYQYPGFQISGYYQEMHKTTSDKEARAYLSDKLQQAQWVASCIEQRTSTLSRVTRHLVQLQHDFFLYGIGHKRPMKLSDLAADLELHESTISRTLRSKYLQCSWGVFPLNYFLTSVASRSDKSTEEKTPEQVKAFIREIIGKEDKQKPLSDQAISRELEAYDTYISRRTVNKYRTQMQIPDKGGRKNW